ncbi:hypothetical protein [Cereibacter ovatus]|uniref:hypothetical protein n=1 Tax=Cereibacter ovatus TaxID=439529 RepID=UPI00195C997A|nr:hypothetical protein [Cereibacter ovatus]
MFKDEPRLYFISVNLRHVVPGKTLIGGEPSLYMLPERAAMPQDTVALRVRHALRAWLSFQTGNAESCGGMHIRQTPQEKRARTGQPHGRFH